jgi:hypothetical protein
MSLYRERLTEEDEKNIDLYLQAYPIAVEATLSEIENSSDLEHQLKFIDELSLILCHNDAVRNPVVQQKLPRVLNLLKDKNFYESASLVVADSCRHIDYIQNLYFDLGVFELLDFENFYKQTIAVVFSLCYKNKKNTEYFLDKYYKEERDGDNEMIDIMKKDYNNNEE